MQSVTVIIILPLLCLANYDNMAVNQADSDYLLFECKKIKQKEKQEKAFWLYDRYLAVSIPEQASGQSQSPGGAEPLLSLRSRVIALSFMLQPSRPVSLSLDMFA